MMTNNEETIRIGYVYVDAGVISIGDPCYVLGDDASNRVTSWSDYCDKLDFKSLWHEPLGKGVQLVVSSGYGDGSYPVDVVVSDEGQWGKRVKSVTVTFIGGNDDDED